MSKAFEAVLYGGNVVISRSANHRYRVSKHGAKSTPCPSVTTILGKKDKSRALLPWATRCSAEKFLQLVQPDTDYRWNAAELADMKAQIENASNEKRDAAGDAGTLVHEWIESIYIGLMNKTAAPTLPEGDWVTDGVLRAATKFLNWVERFEVYPLAMERAVYSMAQHYSGQTDTVLVVGGRVGIWDAKTGKSIYPEVMIQTAAYASALGEEGIMPVADPDRGVTLFERGPDGDLTGEFEPVEFPYSRMSHDLQAFHALHKVYKWDRGAFAELKKIRGI